MGVRHPAEIDPLAGTLPAELNNAMMAAQREGQRAFGNRVASYDDIPIVVSGEQRASMVQTMRDFIGKVGMKWGG